MLTCTRSSTSIATRHWLAADVADRRRREDAPRGALAGLPIALKDLLHIEGRGTSAGSKSWRGRISDHTATAVVRLEAAG
jgi:aspartyl-tRNA(Asn)/glutamyl-tRNA(Gln) amidotransferase subunit A